MEGRNKERERKGGGQREATTKTEGRYRGRDRQTEKTCNDLKYSYCHTSVEVILIRTFIYV